MFVVDECMPSDHIRQIAFVHKYCVDGTNTPIVLLFRTNSLHTTSSILSNVYHQLKNV